MFDANTSSPSDHMWSAERKDLLIQLWEKGLSARQIAAQLGVGVTRNAVIAKVQRLKLPKRATAPRSTARRTLRGDPSLPKIPRNTIETITSRVQTTARPRPIAIPEPEPFQLQGGARITITHLSEKTCKWPIGDPALEDFCFCGHTPRQGSPYCEYHARMAYQPLLDYRHRRFAA
jgi:GcrA cell cycle regulator